MKKHLKGSAVLVCCLILTMIFALPASAYMSITPNKLNISLTDDLEETALYTRYDYMLFASKGTFDDSFVYWSGLDSLGEMLSFWSVEHNESNFPTHYAYIFDDNGSRMMISIKSDCNEIKGDSTAIVDKSDMRTETSGLESAEYYISNMKYTYNNGMLNLISWAKDGRCYTLQTYSISDELFDNSSNGVSGADNDSNMGHHSIDGHGIVARLLTEPENADAIVAELDYENSFDRWRLWLYAVPLALILISAVTVLTVVAVKKATSRKKRARLS